MRRCAARRCAAASRDGACARVQGRVLKLVAWVLAAILSVLIIASRKHYTVDVVIAWYTVPLVFLALERRWTTQRSDSGSGDVSSGAGEYMGASADGGESALLRGESRRDAGARLAQVPMLESVVVDTGRGYAEGGVAKQVDAPPHEMIQRSKPSQLGT